MCVVKRDVNVALSLFPSPGIPGTTWSGRDVILLSYKCPISTKKKKGLCSTCFPARSNREHKHACKKTVKKTSACPLDFPKRHFHGICQKSLAFPSFLSFRGLRIRGARKMISCFQLASEPLSQRWLSVCSGTTGSPNAISTQCVWASPLATLVGLEWVREAIPISLLLSASQQYLSIFLMYSHSISPSLYPSLLSK